MSKMLIAITLMATLLILIVFIFFSAFRYCERGEPERILFCGIGIFTILISVILVIGIMKC